MTSQKRNDLCLCGSGKKYKRCCGSASQPGDNLSDKEFSLLDELNGLMQATILAENARPIDEFLGLSPSQMHLLLNKPFESQEIVTFDTEWFPKSAVLIRIFSMLADGIGIQGVKATGKGNLPLQLSREIRNIIPENNFRSLPFNKIRSEEDFMELNIVRIISRMGGLIQLKKGKYYLTKKGKLLSQPQNRSMLFNNLFQTYVTKFNWGYCDGYPDHREMYLIQNSWLFSLYCLSMLGEKWRPFTFYEDRFIEAFPSIIEYVEGDRYKTAEQVIRRCYSLRVLERFAYFFGLINMRRIESKDSYDNSFELIASNIREWLYFHA